MTNTEVRKFDGITVITLPDEISYEDRELNLFEILGAGHKAQPIPFVDHAMQIYMRLDSESRKKVLDRLPWTRQSRDYYVREFLHAVTLQDAENNSAERDDSLGDSKESDEPL